MPRHPRDSKACLLLLLASLALAGCASLSGRSVRPLSKSQLSQIHNAVPVQEPKSPYGNPSSYVVDGKRYHVLQSSKGYHARGYASWYGPGFDGQRTSSGEKYDMYAMTAANKVLPLPSFVRVTDLENHRSVIVKVNDRGPFHKGRIIDLSYVAAAKLGIINNGSALVEVDAITPGQPSQRQQPAPSPDTARANKPQPPAHPGGLYLQAGAFDQPGHARRLAKRLTEDGLLDAFIVKPDGKQAFYRVRLGPYANAKARAKAAARLRARGISPVNIQK